MTEQQRSVMYMHACDTLESMAGLDPVNCSKDEYLTYGATVAILNSVGPALPEPSQAATPEMAGTNGPWGASLPVTFSDFALLVEDELAGANRYLQYFKLSGKESHRQLARQELSHAAFWLGEAKQAAAGPADTGRAKQWQKKHDEILGQLS